MQDFGQNLETDGKMVMSLVLTWLSLWGWTRTEDWREIKDEHDQCKAEGRVLDALEILGEVFGNHIIWEYDRKYHLNIILEFAFAQHKKKPQIRLTTYFLV